MGKKSEHVIFDKVYLRNKAYAMNPWLLFPLEIVSQRSVQRLSVMFGSSPAYVPVPFDV